MERSSQAPPIKKIFYSALQFNPGPYKCQGMTLPLIYTFCLDEYFSDIMAANDSRETLHRRREPKIGDIISMT